MTSSVLYVAAPIRVKGEITGVLTVAKPTVNINSFLKTAKPRIAAVGGLAAAAAIVLSLVASFWITRPIRRLTAYANDIRAGRRVDLPALDKSEIGAMGQAFEKMRIALEGREYIEQYVQTLTNELKSPLSAIRGAAELLGEKMEIPQRQRFLGNITNEAARIQDLVDRIPLKGEPVEPLRRELENFRDACLGRGQSAVTGSAGREALAVTLSIEERIRSHVANSSPA